MLSILNLGMRIRSLDGNHSAFDVARVSIKDGKTREEDANTYKRLGEQEKI